MARETKIGLVVCACMLLGDHVFDMELNEWQLNLMTSAVFTVVSRAETNQSA